MFGLQRDFGSYTIGNFVYTGAGRPTNETEKTWSVKCNFVFTTKARIVCCTTGQNWGWLIRVQNSKETKDISVKYDDISSNAHMKRFFMKYIDSAICRMNFDDFQKFVHQDSDSMQTLYISEFCGCVELYDRQYWVFPNKTLEKNGSVSDTSIIVSRDSMSKNSLGEKFVLPHRLPIFVPCDKNAPSVLKKLGKLMRDYYGPRHMHALHLLSSIFKAIHRTELMNVYNQVAVTNISGPANVGKTFACAIALKMMTMSDFLMLSRCTPSAMLDTCHVFKDMLVCWDDPRDATHAQLSSIVHESFHGYTSATISKGNRAYHSSLIIGTQERLFGMPSTECNRATFSRVSHVDMTIDDDHKVDQDTEMELKKHMEKLPGLMQYLLKAEINHSQIQKYYKRLKSKADDVIDRSLQIASVDWYFCNELRNMGFLCSEEDIQNYFENVQLGFLQKHCSKTSTFQKFLAHLKELINNYDIPSSCFKMKVNVELQNYGPKDCIALHTKKFFEFLHKQIPASKVYSSDQIHAEVKASKSKIGEVSKNVAYKIGNSTEVKRSIIIRHDVFHTNK